VATIAVIDLRFNLKLVTIVIKYRQYGNYSDYIKQLHPMLLRHSNKDDRHRGEVKNQSNHLEAVETNGKARGTWYSKP
jgi:putative IMPACT (imprinted ancient) family translation regulator